MGDVPKVPEILGHAYWLPPPEGVVLEGLLVELIGLDQDATLTISKTRDGAGKWVYSFGIDRK